MEWVEVTGRTIDEARERALDLLGGVEEDTEVEVLAEAKMGLFGRLREEARVRARLLPAVPRSKDDSRRRRGGSRGPKADGSPAGARPPAAPAAEAPETTVPAPSEAAAPEPAAAGEAASPGAAARRTPGRRGRAAVGVAEQRAGNLNEQGDVANVESMSEDRPEVPLAEQAEVAKQFVEGLLETMGIEGSTTTVVEVDQDTSEVQVTGDDLGLLIGPKGATLLALQDLARTVVQRKTGARTGRLLLDVAGYRAKRREALGRFTEKVAREVLASGAAAALEPMSSADRKVVHDTANGIDGVTTTSEGEDPRRRVVVHPA